MYLLTLVIDFVRTFLMFLLLFYTVLKYCHTLKVQYVIF